MSVSAVMLMVTVVFQAASVVAPPMAIWYVNDTQAFTGQSFTRGNDIVVGTGGFLKMTGCSIIADDPDHSVGIDIIVEVGGRLELTDCVLYGLPDSHQGKSVFDMIVRGSLVARGCIFENLDGVGPVGGIQVYSNDVVITDCSIRNSASSGVYVRSASAVIGGNTVRNSTYGYYFDGSVPSMARTTFSDGSAAQTRNFGGSGSFEDIAVSLPRRANLSDARVTITGSYLQPIPAVGSPWTNGLVRPKGIDEGQWWNDWGYGREYHRGVFVADTTKGVGVIEEGVGYRNIVPIYTGSASSLTNPIDVSSQGDFIYVLDGIHIDKHSCWSGTGIYYATFTTGLKTPKAIDYYNGRIYVADATNKLVVLDCDSGGKVQGITTELSRSILDVSVCSSGIFVLDGTHIDVFSLDGTWLRKTSLGLSSPVSLDVSDKIYVANSNKLVVLNLDGSLCAEVTSAMTSAKSVAAGALNRVYVQDNGNHIDAFACGYPLSPSLDFACDGDVDWSYQGSFSGSALVDPSSSTIVTELKSALPGMGQAEIQIPIRMSVAGSGVLTLSNVEVDYTIPAIFGGNVALSNQYGVVFKNTDSLTAVDYSGLRNAVDISFEGSSLEIANSTVRFSTQYDLSIDSSSYPNLVNVEYDRSKVLVNDPVDSDSDGLVNAAERYIYGTNASRNDTDGDGYGDGWEIAHGGNPLNASDDGGDDDLDLLGNMMEAALGTDPMNRDSDDDGLWDGVEYHTLKSDPLSSDTDSDGLSDGIENSFGTNLTSGDSDNDGLIDGDEPAWSNDTDNDGKINALDPDSDDDGLEDGNESRIGTKIIIPDSDNDGIQDGPEFLFWQRMNRNSTTPSIHMNVSWNSFFWPSDWAPTDAAYLVNTFYKGKISSVSKLVNGHYESYNPGTPIRHSFQLDPGSDVWIYSMLPFELMNISMAFADFDGDRLVNILDNDSDNDGLLDGNEMRLWGTLDSDGDSFPNIVDQDSDNDGIHDSEETENGTSAILQDTDSDGLGDFEELFVYGTNPARNDTDGDWMLDQAEVQYWISRGLNPVTADTDGDGLRNIVDVDSDNDLLPDGWEYNNNGDPMFSIYVPTAPLDFISIPWGGGGSQLRVSWNLPAYDGGSPVTGYRLSRGLSPGVYDLIATPGSADFIYDDSGLTPETKYYYKLVAVNANGDGAPAEMNATPTMFPSAPLDFFAVPHDGKVVLTWQPPQYSGAGRLGGYHIYRRTSTTPDAMIAELDRSARIFNDTSVINDETYLYTIRALNSFGDGAPNQTWATPGRCPSAPTNLVAVAGDRYVDLTWSPPTTNGSAPLAGFKIYRLGLSGQYELMVSTLPGVLTFHDAGLNNGQTYSYRVTALNAFDEGQPASVSAKPCTLPGPPLSLSASPGGPLKIQLVWSPPSYDGGDEISGYLIIRDMVSPPYQVAFIQVGNTPTSYLDTVPSYGEYDYTLRAQNSAGEGENGNWAHSFCGQVQKPSAPNNLSATPGVLRITLTWSPPSSNGSADITRYTIYSWTTGTAKIKARVPGTVLSWTDTNVKKNTKYNYYITANNSAGEGPKSGTVSAIPLTSAMSASATWSQVTSSGVRSSSNLGSMSVYSSYQTSQAVLAAQHTLFLSDYSMLDSDNDGLLNGQEGGVIYPTSPSCNDTDGDGLLDGEEVDFWNDITANGALWDADNDGLVNVVDPDSDNDQIIDGREKRFMEAEKLKRPSLAVNASEDFDRDGMCNILDPDSDNDLALDGEELMYAYGGGINERLMFDQTGSYSLCKSIDVSIPITKDGTVVPLRGGVLNITGTRSGLGTYSEHTTYDLPISNIIDIEGGDLNGDGTIDLVAAGEDGNVAILLNRDNKSFYLNQTCFVGGKLSGVDVGDLNWDGLLDIGVSIYDLNSVAMLFNLGNGSFGPALRYGAGLGPTSCYIDGYNGLWTAHSGWTNVSRTTQYGAQSIIDVGLAGWILHHPRTVICIAADTANSIYCSMTANPADQSVFIYMFYVSEDHSHHEDYIFLSFTGYRPYSLDVSDCDHNGLRDIFIVDPNSPWICVKRHRDVRTFDPAIWLNGGTSYSISAVDINGDGYSDIVFPDADSTPSLGRYLNDVNGQFPVSSLRSYPAEPEPRSVWAGDFDGDTSNDIAVGHYGQQGKVSVYPNGEYPKSPALFIGSDDTSGGNGKKVWSHNGTYNDSVTVGGMYEEILKYLERTSICSDADDGRIDGRITVPLVFRTDSPGGLWIKSTDMGGTVYSTDPFDNDTDNDGLLDGVEIRNGLSDPQMPDTDSDGMKDSQELDYWKSNFTTANLRDINGDGVIENMLRVSDCDFDGLTDGEEVSRSLDPLDADSDDDGIGDFYDLSPKAKGDQNTIVWTDQYAPGMLRTIQDVDTYYFPGYPYETVEKLHYEYDYLTEECNSWHLESGAVSNQDAVRGKVAADLVVASKIDTGLQDMNAEQGTSWGVLNVQPLDFTHPLGEFVDTLYGFYGGTGWSNEFQYQFRYDYFKRTDRVTIANTQAMPYNGQKYSLSRISILPNSDQTIAIQLRIDSGYDATFFQSQYVMPAIRYSLFRTNDFDSDLAFYSMTATGIPLGNHCYQFNLRIPSGAVPTGNLVESNGDYSAILYMDMQWLHRDYPVWMSPLDPSNVVICAVVDQVYESAYALFAKQTANLSDVRSKMPSDIAGYSTGSRNFGGYGVYVCNLADGGALPDSVIKDQNCIAVVIIGSSIESIGTKEALIDWGAVGDKWCVPATSGYQALKNVNKYVKMVKKSFDVTPPRTAWSDVRFKEPIDFTTLEAKEIMVCQKLQVDDLSILYNCKRTIVTGQIGQQTSSTIWVNRHLVDDWEEFERDLDSSYLAYQRYSMIKLAMKGAAVGSTWASYGASSYLAIRDGDYVRGIVYGMQGYLGTWAAWKDGKAAVIGVGGGKAFTFPYGAAATIAINFIELGFDMYAYGRTSDTILQRHYVEAACALPIDMTISLTPYGAIFQGTWAITIAALSKILPNHLAATVCSQGFGHTAVFLFAIYCTDDVPSDLAEEAYGKVAMELSVIVGHQNEVGRPAILILPES